MSRKENTVDLIRKIVMSIIMSSQGEKNPSRSLQSPNEIQLFKMCSAIFSKSIIKRKAFIIKPLKAVNA